MPRRLELTSIDNNTVKGRARAALRQLKEERVQSLHLIEREMEASARRMQHDYNSIKMDAAYLGSFGSQVDISKFNSLSGTLFALDYAIQLLEQVINGVP